MTEVDVAGQIGAVQRELRDGERDGKPVKVLVATQTYDTDVADLWDALTSAERIPRWMLPVSGDLRVGGRYQLEGNAGGEVLVCDAPSRLSITWEWGTEISWVDVRLRPVAEGRTHLELEHAAEVDDERWGTYGPGAVGVGWDLLFIGLSLHLRSGGAQVDPVAVQAWGESDEGRGFMTESSEAWGRASAAAGEDETAAMAAAARTTAFYTGAPAPDEPADGAAGQD